MVLPALIGLTGGIACGKSTAAHAIAASNIPVIDLDTLARETQAPGAAGWRAVVKAFGEGILEDSDNNSDRSLRALDRQRLADAVFGDVALRKKLDQIMLFPIARALVLRILKLWWVHGEAQIVLDAPLLFEARLDRLCAATICVDAGGKENQIERLRSRDNCTREQALARIRAQLPQAEKVARADFVLENSGTRNQLAAATSTLFKSGKLPPSPFRRALFHTFRIGIPLAMLSLLVRFFW